MNSLSIGTSYSPEEIDRLKTKHNAKPYNVQEQAKKIIENEEKYQQLRRELMAKNVFTHVAAREVLNKILFEWREDEGPAAGNDGQNIDNSKGSENDEPSQGVGLFRRLGEGMKTGFNKVSTSIPVRRSTITSIDSNAPPHSALRKY